MMTDYQRGYRDGYRDFARGQLDKEPDSNAHHEAQRQEPAEMRGTPMLVMFKIAKRAILLFCGRVSDTKGFDETRVQKNAEKFRELR